MDSPVVQGSARENLPAVEHPKWLTPFLNAFDLREQGVFAEHHAHVFVLEHRATGGIIVVNRDDNPINLLQLSIETRPEDDTGLPHVTEHIRTRKSELLPGISDTYGILNHSGWFNSLNAATGSSETSYYVGSDHPREAVRLGTFVLHTALSQVINRRDFEIEGIRVSAEKGDLFIRGIVQKEMCGYEGSPNISAALLLSKAIYPDTHLRFNSGGDPEAMRGLTYEQFEKFNQQYYHPTYSRVFISGRDDPTPLIAEAQSLFERCGDRRDPLPKPHQPLFNKPISTVAPYPWAADDLENAPTVLCTGWVLPQSWGKLSSFELEVIDDLLGDKDEGVLSKAFNTEKLSAPVVTGFCREHADSFRIYCHDLALEDQARVTDKILDALRTLCTEGISHEQLLRSLQRMEYEKRREFLDASERGPGQVDTMLESYERFGSFLSDFGWQSSAEYLLCHLHKKAQQYVELIREGLCENPHRASVAAYPDAEMAQRLEKNEEHFLMSAKASMNAAELDRAEAHERYVTQQARNMLSGDLTQIPALNLNEIPSGQEDPPIVATRAAGQILEYSINSPGLTVAHLLFDLSLVPDDLRLYAALLPNVVSHAPSRTGHDSTLPESWACPDLSLHARTNFSTQEPVCRLCFGLEGLSEKFEADLARVKAVFDPAWITPAIVRQSVLDFRLTFSELAHNAETGPFTQRAASAFSSARRMIDQISDLGFAEFINSILADEKSRGALAWKDVTQKVVASALALFQRQGARFQLIHGDAPSDHPGALLEQVLQDLPNHKNSVYPWSSRRGPLVQGVILPARGVGHVSQVLDFGSHGLDPSQHGALLVLASYYENIDLWRTVRGEGSAYRVGCIWGQSSHVWTYESGWNPDPLDAIGVFNRLSRKTRTIEMSGDMLHRSKIGALREFANSYDPVDRGWEAFLERQLGVPPGGTEMLRSQIMKCTVADVQALYPLFEAAMENPAIVVAGPARMVKRTVKELGAPETAILRI